jgi:hypothetical protein
MTYCKAMLLLWLPVKRARPSPCASAIGRMESCMPSKKRELLTLIFTEEKRASNCSEALRLKVGKCVLPGIISPKLDIIWQPLQATQTYPHNPNGSDNATAGVTNESGQVTLMMPHPERVIRTVQNSYRPKDWHERSPWMKMFDNARACVFAWF